MIEDLGRADPTPWLLPLRRWRVSSTMSPAEITAALKDFDTDWILSGREVPGLDGLRFRGWVEVSGFRIRALPLWQHAYIPWVLASVSPATEGAEIRIVVRPSIHHLLFLGAGFLAMGYVGSPWFALFVAAASHIGSLWLGFRPEVQLLEGRLREIIPGRWELC